MIRKISAAFAALVLTSLAMSAQNPSGGVVAKKQSVNNYDGTYTINIETYVTGTSVTSSGVVSKPVDAVLVLDFSTSMASPTGNGGTFNQARTSSGGYAKVYNYDTAVAGENQSFYISSGYGNYQAVEKINNKYYSAGKEVSSNQNLYVGPTSRIVALRRAVDQFVRTMKAEQDKYNYETKLPEEDFIQHSVSIVSFSTEAELEVGLSGSRTLLPVGILDVDKDNTPNMNKVLDIVASVNRSGYTRADLGMQVAYGELDDYKRDGTDKLIVFFTDGVPTKTGMGQSFEPEVANPAIKASYDSKKDFDATVYTVSVMSQKGDADKFLHFISSEYPDAQSMNNYGKVDPEHEYVMIAPDETALKNAFVSIASTFISGGASIELNSSTITADIVMSDFEISKSVGAVQKDDIDVYIMPFTGIDSGTGAYTWGTPEAAADSIKVVVTDDAEGNHVVRLTGFDFSEHWCGFDKIVGQPDVVHPGGQKLCLDILIVPNPDSDGGYLQTNHEDSGIYIKKDGVETLLQRFSSVPKVYSSCDIIVRRYGMSKGESAIYKVRRYKGTDLDTSFERDIILTGDGTDYAQTIVKGDVTYLSDPTKPEDFDYYVYEVLEHPVGNWDWNYTTETTSLKHALYDEDLDLTKTNLFEFGSTRGDTLDSKSFEETSKKNKFKKYNVSTSE